MREHERGTHAPRYQRLFEPTCLSLVYHIAALTTSLRVVLLDYSSSPKTDLTFTWDTRNTPTIFRFFSFFLFFVSFSPVSNEYTESCKYISNLGRKSRGCLINHLPFYSPYWRKSMSSVRQTCSSYFLWTSSRSPRLVEEYTRSRFALDLDACSENILTFREIPYVSSYAKKKNEMSLAIAWKEVLLSSCLSKSIHFSHSRVNVRYNFLSFYAQKISRE